MNKPKCKLTKTNGNVFALIGRVRKVLRKAGMEKEAKEMCDKVMKSGSYDEALQVMMEYVEAE